MKRYLTGSLIIFCAFSAIHVAKAADLTTGIHCNVYRSGVSQELDVKASFSIKHAPNDSKSVKLEPYEIILTAFGGDGGESGNVVVEIRKTGVMIHKTMWQSGDAMSKAGQTSGLSYVVESPQEAGGAELQYSCSSK